MASRLRTKDEKLVRIRSMRHRTLGSLSASLLIIPDLNFRTPKTSLESIWSQLSPAFTSELQIFVAGFEYTWDPNIKSIWDFLSELGDTLLQLIALHAEEFKLDQRPLVFIAYGLGGILLKRALSTVYNTSVPPAPEFIQRVHSGTVFVGTPHPTFKRRKEWFKLSLLLRANLKLSRICLAQAELEWAKVAYISERFEQSGLDVTVLSICESKNTKVPTGLWVSEKHILVDRYLAQISTRYGRLIEVKADHHELMRCVPNTEMFKAIQEFMKATIDRYVGQPSTEASGIDQTSTILINDDLEENEWLSDETGTGSGTIALTPATSVNKDVDQQNDVGELLSLTEFVSQEKEMTIPCHLLRPAIRNPDFLGRESVLEEIDRALLPRSRRLRPTGDELQSFALSGLGGVGKTQIAIEYAFSRQAKFDAIFWIEADEPTQLAEGFGRIASQLGFSDSADVDRVVSRNVALQWLAKPRKKISRECTHELNDAYMAGSEATWLVIFNNADDLELLQSYWPIGSCGSILITTRDPFAKRGRAGRDVDSFCTNDAAALLLRKLSTAQDSPQTKQTSIELASRLGGLPLAIVQIAALVDRWDMTIREFLEFYDKQVTIVNVAQNNPGSLQDHYKHSLFTVWALEDLKPSTTILLRIMSFLSPDRIQESLFTHNLPQDLQSGFPSNDTAYITARADMLKVSLVKRNKADKELVLHRLVQDVVQARMTTSEATATFETTIGLLMSAWPTPTLRFDHNVATWEKSELLLHHIVRVQRVYRNYKTLTFSNRVTKDFARLLLFAGWYLLERSDYYTSRPLLHDVLQICRQHPNPIEMNDILADVLFSLSALSAQIHEEHAKNLRYAQEHFELRLKALDDSQFAKNRLATAHGELAHIYLLIGRYNEAIRHSNTAISMTKESPEFLAGDDWPTFSHCHQAFALVALSRFDEAEHLLCDTLEYWASYSNARPHSFILGIVYRCLGYLRKKQERPEESLAAYQTALLRFKESVGDKSHYTSQICSSLGDHHAGLGQYETARIYFGQAIMGFEMHDCYKAELAQTFYRLSQAQEAEGDEAGARCSLMEAQTLYNIVGDPSITKRPLTAAEFERVLPVSSR